MMYCVIVTVNHLSGISNIALLLPPIVAAVYPGVSLLFTYIYGAARGGHDPSIPAVYHGVSLLFTYMALPVVAMTRQYPTQGEF